MNLERNILNEKDLSEVSGGAVWKPCCPSCGKVMAGGVGVIRIHKEGAKHPYFCTECAEKFLNSGEAVIDSGFEKHYQKYEKSKDEKTGKIIYGWKKFKLCR